MNAAFGTAATTAAVNPLADKSREEVLADIKGIKAIIDKAEEAERDYEAAFNTLIMGAYNIDLAKRYVMIVPPTFKMELVPPRYVREGKVKQSSMADRVVFIADPNHAMREIFSDNGFTRFPKA
ncbi:hypothetical protein [Paraburkholderia sp. C35]|uniref:hypothetical protein n=1 Tax=Paraburkholderia sp. C35 TaxID=2126993 RepID=UPI0013A52D67|nr:hypothetical protein [Paraburkholderia sp. C35]